MNVLLLAHGDGWRWNGPDGRPYLGVPKQLVELDGEVLLERTVRQLLAAGVEVTVVAPDERFDVSGARRVSIEPKVSGCDQDKFLATSHLWSDVDRTVIMWGDVWYSDKAVAAIVGHAGGDLHYFRRPWPSEVTGCEWDESFAVSFGPDERERVLRLAWEVAFWWGVGAVHTTHIRTHLAASVDLPGALWADPEAVVDVPCQTVIDDWTDDIDSPEEYERWTQRRASQ